jgi:MGT family glycosyltransferase
MATFLFCPWPALGDCYPLMAIAAPLRARGHDVHVFCEERLAGVVDRLGMPRVPAPPLEPAALAARGSGCARYLLDPLPAQLEALDRAVTALRPDVLIDGVLPFGPRLIGERRGIPHASVTVCACPLPSRDLFPFGLGMAPPHDAMTRLLAKAASERQAAELADEAAHWDRICGSIGLPATGVHPWLDLPSRELILIPTTASFEYPRSDLPAHAHFVGPLPWRGGDSPALPEALGPAIAAGRPIIFVCQGTFMTMDYPIVRLALAALGSEPVTVVVSTGRELDAGELGELPPNAIVRPSLDLARLFPHCALAIVHGGFGTVSEALSAAVPLIVMPLFADQPEVAQRCEVAGVGVRLDPRTCDAASLRDAVRELLTEPRYRLAAQRIADSYATHDGPREAADLLERLARERTPITTWP